MLVVVRVSSPHFKLILAPYGLGAFFVFSSLFLSSFLLSLFLLRLLLLLLLLLLVCWPRFPRPPCLYEIGNTVKGFKDVFWNSDDVYLRVCLLARLFAWLFASLFVCFLIFVDRLGGIVQTNAKRYKQVWKTSCHFLGRKLLTFGFRCQKKEFFNSVLQKLFLFVVPN